MSKKKTKKGFALLYAILLSGAVLSVGLILMNIITKQLLFSSLNRESEVTYYYLANSGRECLTQAITRGTNDGFVNLDITNWDLVVSSRDVTLTCFTQPVTLEKQVGQDVFKGKVNVDGKLVDLEVQVNPNCINGGSCYLDQGGAIDLYAYVAIATGYSGQDGATRTVRRSAVYVEKAGG